MSSKTSDKSMKKEQKGPADDRRKQAPDVGEQEDVNDEFMDDEEDIDDEEETDEATEESGGEEEL